MPISTHLRGHILLDRLPAVLGVAFIWMAVSNQTAFSQVAYSYIGRPFNLFSCGGDTICSTPNPASTSYTANDFVAATFTVAHPLPGNLSLQDIRGLAGFSLTMYDGRQKMILEPGTPGEAFVSTDAAGRMAGLWSVFVNCCSFPNNNIYTLNWPGGRGVGDGGALTAPTGAFPGTPRNQGMNFQSPGVWIGGTVVAADDAAHGPGSITRDLATGLDWLDLTQTQGLTRATVLGQTGAGGRWAGFRHATSDEVFQFFTNAGVPVVATDFGSLAQSASNVPSVAGLISKWGAALIVPAASFASAYLGDGPAPNKYYLASLTHLRQLDLANAGVRGSSIDAAAVPPGGHALVRFTPPAVMAAGIISQIEALAAGGILAPDQASGLTAKLNALISSVNRGNGIAGCGQLGAFLNQLEALVRSGSLSAAAAEPLRTSAMRLSASLGC